MALYLSPHQNRHCLSLVHCVQVEEESYGYGGASQDLPDVYTAPGAFQSVDLFSASARVICFSLNISKAP